MITHCQHKCLEKQIDISFVPPRLTFITKKKYLDNPLRALVLPRKIQLSSTISHFSHLLMLKYCLIKSNECY